MQRLLEHSLYGTGVALTETRKRAATMIKARMARTVGRESSVARNRAEIAWGPDFRLSRFKLMQYYRLYAVSCFRSEVKTAKSFNNVHKTRSNS